MWFSILSEPIGLAYGISFMGIASIWSVLTDRAGRPGMESTHKTIQAYLASQGNDFDDAEELMEQRSNETKVITSQLRLSSPNGETEFRMVLPEIHPGPYHPVGGSNIPYLIYKNLSSSAMVMHSISDHSLNLPSRNEVENYLKKIQDSKIKEEGLQCTEPVTVQINKARVIGLLFGNNPLLFLSLSPHGMEDIPSYMKTEIEQYAKNRNYSRTMIVDCHNAMGEEISKEDGEDMLKAAKSCLDTLITKENYPIEFGYANSDDMDVWTEDLGMGGLGIVCLVINNKKYFLGWADANNMENGVREKIIDNFSKLDYNLLEICTSDTHYAPVKARNRNGYYQLGLITSADKLSKWFLEIARNAESDTRSAKFEILENEANVMVMGHEIYEDYSKALDNSLKITKAFVIGGVLFFITSLFL
jgi:putative membrane protein